MKTLVPVILAATVSIAALQPFTPAVRAQSTGEGPRLLVLLVVDQLRSDYLERYSARWDGGLKRLMQEGSWYTNAAFPYMNTVTCTGHSTLSTGRFPRSHGLILNAWFDRELGQSISCSADDKESTVTATGVLPGVGDSARRLQGATLADRVKDAGGRVVTMSLKARSAIMPAGRHADAAVWFGSGGFVTSTAYGRELPAFVREVEAARPIDADRTPPWTRRFPDDAYTGPDDGLGERPPAGWTSVFPHPFDAAPGRAEYLALWVSSPRSDAYLGRLAAAAVKSYGLGRGPKTDLLSVSFSALDVVGHAFGPNSHEIQDMLAHLDETIGTFLRTLDEQVGAGRYLLALTADHGVAPIPEQSRAEGLDAGRMAPVQVARAVNLALAPIFGEAPYVTAVHYTDLYFQRGVWDRVRSNSKALAAVKQAILQQPGVAAVFTSAELEKVSKDDPLQRAAALSYFKGRSGDIVMVPKRWWIASSAGTTHGTLHDYDQRVPVIFFGAGVGAGRFDAPATPADVAPTLAQMGGLRLKNTDGQPLAVRPAAAPATKP